MLVDRGRGIAAGRRRAAAGSESAKSRASGWVMQRVYCRIVEHERRRQAPRAA